MKVFEGYAKYYDLLYQDKDYRSEADFVLEAIRQFRPCIKNLLELGCGSGGHAQVLADLGISVLGVDRSVSMIEKAQIKAQSLSSEVSRRLTFMEADIRHLRLERRFDGAIALFHVMSYQLTNTDVVDAFRAAGEHLHSGGLFVFDCWYGPGVISDRPTVRVKHWTDKGRKITRIAEPIMHPRTNSVDVNYTVFSCNADGGSLEETRETHQMRYFFEPELEMLAAQAGLRIVESREWMASKAPDFGTWTACFVAQK